MCVRARVLLCSRYINQSLKHLPEPQEQLQRGSGNTQHMSLENSKTLEAGEDRVQILFMLESCCCSGRHPKILSFSECLSSLESAVLRAFSLLNDVLTFLLSSRTKWRPSTFFDPHLGWTWTLTWTILCNRHNWFKCCYEKNKNLLRWPLINHWFIWHQQHLNMTQHLRQI